MAGRTIECHQGGTNIAYMCIEMKANMKSVWQRCKVSDRKCIYSNQCMCRMVFGLQHKHGHRQLKIHFGILLHMFATARYLVCPFASGVNIFLVEIEIYGCCHQWIDWLFQCVFHEPFSVSPHPVEMSSSFTSDFIRSFSDNGKHIGRIESKISKILQSFHCWGAVVTTKTTRTKHTRIENIWL